MDSHPNACSEYAASVPPELAIPLVETAFHRDRHADWPRLREHSHAWLLAQRLMPVDIAQNHADGLRYTNLIAGYYVGASSAALEMISDFSIWFFVWDDFHGRCAFHRHDQAWQRLKRDLHLALDAPEWHLRDADPLVAGLADCVHRFNAQLPRRWADRFALHFHEVIDGYDQEYAQRIVNQVPDVETYKALRCLTFGYWVWLDCLELAAGCELPPDIIAWDEYRRAGLASQEFSGWYNDLCSLPKELAAGEIHNLGICLIRHDGLSLEQATIETRRRIEERVKDFLLAEQQVLHRLERSGLPPDVDKAVRHCVLNMRNWISSVYWFHHESSRYRVADWQDSSQPPYVHDTESETCAP
jgi:epi-isozizaene synthase